MKIKPYVHRVAEIGVGLTVISLLILAGCGGGGGGSSNSATGNPTAAIKIIPSIGQFAAGATVTVIRPADNSVIATAKTDSTGTATVNVPTNTTGPLLIQAGKAGDTYFDPSTGTSATVPANTTAIRALVPDVTTSSAVAVTALTEIAVGQIEGASGIAGVTSIGVYATNATVGSQFGVTNPLKAPTLIGANTSPLNGGNDADDYALKLAGLAKLSKSGTSSLTAIHDLRDDIKDGKFDGLKSGAPITSYSVAIPASGVTLSQMNMAITSQVQAATASYGNTGTASPTVTLTVQDLNALLAAAMQVGAEAQKASAGSTLPAATLNSQISSIITSQVSTIATTAGANGGTAAAVVAATPAAITNATNAGTVLATASTSVASSILAAMKTGTYQLQANFNPASGVASSASLISASVTKIVMPPTSTLSAWTNSFNSYSPASVITGAWTAIPNGTGNYWTMTSLTVGGWYSNQPNGTQQGSVTDNGDGTWTEINSTTGDKFSEIPQQITLDGQQFGYCAPNCPAGAVFPTGSTKYDFANKVSLLPSYSISSGYTNASGVAVTNAVTDSTGVTLTALPALGATTFCVSDHVFRPIAGAPAGANNYDVIYTGITGVVGCTAANITAATAPAQTWTNGSVLIVNDATGNATVPNVWRITVVTPGAGQAASIMAWLPNWIFAPVGGTLYYGSYQPVTGLPILNGNNSGNGMMNKTAAQAVVNSLGATATLP